MDRLRLAGKRMTDPLESLAQRVAERVIDLVVDVLDLNALVQSIDLNAVLNRIDINEILKNVDVSALVDRVDINDVLQRVDVGALLDRIDMNDLVQRLDIDALVEQTDLGAVIAKSSGGIATDALDAARSQAVGLDGFIDRWVQRALRRKYAAPSMPPALLDGQLPDAEAPDAQLPDAEAPDAQLPDTAPDAPLPDGELPDTARHRTGRPAARRRTAARHRTGRPAARRRAARYRPAARCCTGRPAAGCPALGWQGTVMSARAPANWVSAHGHYSGSVSRLVAYAIDLGVSAGLFALALKAISFTAKIVTGNSITWNRDNISTIHSNTVSWRSSTAMIPGSCVTRTELRLSGI